ncbi:PAS domain S-box protein [Sphingomonas sp. RB3P16]|uniref:PAS domain S-box protein n=1 Tax=Parasphingomonas frigoris TaxID=3096163 RepID=UPI002FC7641A
MTNDALADCLPTSNAPRWTDEQREAALRAYDILDTPIESDFDDIAKLASEALNAPIAVVNLISNDRQWFKAEVGIGARELPMDVSICKYALLEDDLLVIPDTRLDPRVDRNPLVTPDDGLRFYAGALLRTPAGIPIGTVCVLDRSPRPKGITAFQRLTLEVLARQVMTQLELRRALTHQRKTDQRHRLIVDSAIDYGIITMDLHGLITSWNIGACRLMGWEEIEMVGRPCGDFFTPEDREHGVPAKEMGSALTNGRGVDERWHMRKDDSQFWASGEMMPLTDDDDKPIGFLKILRDRTVQREAHEALEDSEIRTRLALEAGGLGAWQSSPSLREMTWDARTRELLGHSAEEPLDYETSFLARVHPSDRAHVVAANAAAVAPDGDGTTDIEYRTISAVDGKERWVNARGALVRGPDGGKRFVGTVRDITTEKEAEAHRVLLTGELQHRIKNTMAVVQSIVSQSLRNVSTPEEARDAISERLTTLGHAHDLLVQSSWTAAPMAMIVEGATRLHGAKPGRILISGPEIQLNAKAALAFSMSLHELSTNAAKYGALSNEVGHVELGWTTIELEDGESALLVRWQEYGGPPVNLPTSTGFGSRLMRGLARDMGGVAKLEYEPEGVVWTLDSNLAAITGPIDD